MKIAYIMSRFPRITETFILYEILAMERLGLSIEIYPLLRQRARVVHAEVDRLADHVHYHPFLSWSIMCAHWHFVCRQPLNYFKTLAVVLRSTFGSINFFVGAIGIFPKSVRFAYEMQQSGVSHVHAHFATHPTVSAFLINRLTGIPFSFTAHGSDLHVERRMLDKKVEAAAFAVTVSSYNKEVIVKECGEELREKVQIVHCGVDPEIFSPSEPKNEDRPFHVLCVAALRDVKGHKHLVDACEILHRRGVDFVCDLVGDGPLRRRLRAQIERLGLQGKVLLHGTLPREGVVKMMSNAGVAALTSVPTPEGRQEGIPTVLMEAMASTVPVVASRLSGIPELVDHERSGLLVPPGDAHAIADALQRLSEDSSLRQKMGTAGRDKVIREFNMHTTTAKLAELFINPT